MSEHIPASSQFSPELSVGARVAILRTLTADLQMQALLAAEPGHPNTTVFPGYVVESDGDQAMFTPDDKDQLRWERTTVILGTDETAGIPVVSMRHYQPSNSCNIHTAVEITRQYPLAIGAAVNQHEREGQFAADETFVALESWEAALLGIDACGSYQDEKAVGPYDIDALYGQLHPLFALIKPPERHTATLLPTNPCGMLARIADAVRIEHRKRK